MGFLNVGPQFQTLELGQHPVAQVAVVLRTAHVQGIHQPQVHHFGVEQEVQRHQIGTAFLQGGTVLLDGFFGCPNTRLQLSRRVANDLVHCGVQFASQLTVGLDAHHLHFVVGKLGEHTSPGSLVVGIDNVPKGHGLGAVDLTDPVAVGQVDPNGGAWGGIACFSSNVDHVVRDAHHFFLLVRLHEGHVVFEPLGVVHQGGHARAGIKVLDFHHRFIAPSVPERVVVDLDEAIDVIHIALRVLDPVDVVQAPLLQIARFVVGHQIAQGRGLLFILGIFASLHEPTDDLFDALSVKTVQLVDILHHFSLLVFLQTAVQAILHRTAVVAVGNALEVGFGLFCGNVRSVKIDCRTLHQSLGPILLDLLGLHCGVEDDRPQLAVHFISRGREQMVEVRLPKTRQVLGVGIVVVDAIGKPNALEVDLKRLPSLHGTIAFVIEVDVLQQPTDAEVVAVVLVVHDVPATQPCHVQAVDQGLLTLGELLPPGDLVPDNLQVGELLRLPNEAFFVRRTGRSLCGQARLKIGTRRRRRVAAAKEHEKRESAHCAASSQNRKMLHGVVLV